MTGTAWKAPGELALGQLGTLELRQPDPGLPAPPRPGEDRLGVLAVRGVEPLADGRGWRITVQPMAPGIAVVPPLDLGTGRLAEELRITVPRTVPFGAPWMGVGGGGQDRLSALPCPWPWTLPLLLPLAAAGWFLVRRHALAAPARRRRAARRAFSRKWPPAGAGRAELDAAHAAGRALLAAHFGPEALGWGPEACLDLGLGPWAAWIRGLDDARFALSRPALPSLAALLAALEGR